MVFNAPFSNTRSVVELVIAEIIALARHLTDKNAAMHAGVWDKSAKGAHEVRGRTLGIVGYGNIGSQLSVVAESLGMRVYFYDVADKLALGNARRCASLDELLEVAETVTLHVDGRPGNAGLFGAEQFAKMRPRSLFLNLCRGIVVDHEALREPPAQRPPRRRRGRRLRRRAEDGRRPVRLQPAGPAERDPDPAHRRLHRGGPGGHRPVRGRQARATSPTDGSTTMSVNLPQVQTHDADGRTRILHVHHNVPGVLATVNGVLADSRVNIEHQVLSTRGELGYVITDIAGPPGPALVDKLQSLPETVRLRVLT